jgi:hypothetical protein
MTAAIESKVIDSSRKWGNAPRAATREWLRHDSKVLRKGILMMLALVRSPAIAQRPEAESAWRTITTQLCPSPGFTQWNVFECWAKIMAEYCSV